MYDSTRSKFRDASAILSLGIAAYLFYIIFLVINPVHEGLLGEVAKEGLLYLFGMACYPLPFIFLFYGINVLFIDFNLAQEKIWAMVLFVFFSSASIVIKDMPKVATTRSLDFMNDFRPTLLVYIFPLMLVFLLTIKVLTERESIGNFNLFFYFFSLLSIMALVLYKHESISRSVDPIIAKMVVLASSKSSGGAAGAIIALPFLVLFGSTGSLILLFALSLSFLVFFANTFLWSSLGFLFRLFVMALRLIFGGVGSTEVGVGMEERFHTDLLEDKPVHVASVEALPQRTPSEPSPISAPIFNKEKAPASITEKVERLEEVLRDHGISAEVVDHKSGPRITRFELLVSKGVRVRKVIALSDDIAMNLEAKSIRIEAPIPGKNAIGIEIPNDISESVSFSSLISKKNPKNTLDIILGKDIIGEDIVVDLRSMPHLLVAGRTGAGKSVGINCIISSIIYYAKPSEVKFIMIDPKMVELMPYNGIPHLYVPVITDPKKAAVALKWAVVEMEKRYFKLAEKGVRNIEGYNQKVAGEKLPYIVIVIDELADLMMTSPASVEESIARVAQKARAVGIHLVIATQRPSIDVITGTIKANLPSRISFAVTSQIDSRTILDTPGAEKLLGRGDMLFLKSSSPNLVRIQGANISEEEVVTITNKLKLGSPPEYHEEILKEDDSANRDELYGRALAVIKAEGRVSTTLIQRKLQIGYSRAARIIDQMEEDGIVRIGDNGEKEIMEEHED